MPARLVVKAGLTDQKEYRLEPDKLYAIGRARDSDIIIKDQRASRRHCTLQRSGDGQWSLTDNQSSNGTYVNRQRIDSRPLHDGDTVQVGQATLQFQCPEEAPAPTQPEAAPQPEAAEEPAEAPTQPEAEPQARQALAEAPPAAQDEQEESDEDLNEELKGLFDFLDRIDAGEQPAAPRPRPASDKPSEEDEPSEGEGGDEGGLMDFLRKKKQD